MADLLSYVAENMEILSKVHGKPLADRRYP